MRELLIACGDVEVLKQLISQIPPTEYKPIATKRQRGLIQKISGRNIQEAIIHENLEDGSGAQLLEALQTLTPVPKVLYLTGGAPSSLEDSLPYTKALQYPIPAPVLRRALKQLGSDGDEGLDSEKWRLFYRELKSRSAKLASMSYYDILGVPMDAPHHLIVRAFDGASVRYHPDRYAQLRHEKWGEAIWQEANSIYKAMTESYGVVSDKKARKLYDEALAQGELRISSDQAQRAKTSGPQTIESLGQSAQAKKFLRMAQADVANRNWSRAIQNLRFALSMEPGNAKIEQKIAQIEAKL